jgi:hypothetical protein
VKARNTLVALLVFGGLLAWVYFYEYRGEEGRKKAEAAGKKVFDFETDKAQSLEITKSGATLSLTKADGQWKLTSPIAARADSDEVSGLLSTLSWLEVNQKIEATPADLDTYKLEDPPFRLTLTTEGGTAPFVLAIGDKAPIGGVYYARRLGAGAGDAGDVITVSSSIDRLMEATADKLRYKKVVGVDSWKVSRFSIVRGGSMVAFTKNGEDWRMDSPASFPADRGKVSNLLYDLTSISAEGFEPEGTTAGSVGLSRPEATLQIDVKDGTPVTVEFSAKDPDGVVRARRPDMAEIFKVKPDLLDKLAPKLDEYRDMRVAPVDRWQVSEIDAVSPDGEKKIVKDTESNWRWGDPNGPTLDQKMVNDLLDALDAAKATGVREGADSKEIGLSGVRLSVKAGSAAPVEVRIGQEQGGKVLMGSSASTAIYEVEKSLADRLSDSVRALKASSPGDSATASGAEAATKPAPEGRNP